MNKFEKQLIKDTFKKCFGLKSCLMSVRTQKIAIATLSEKTGIRSDYIESNLEVICNL